MSKLADYATTNRPFVCSKHHTRCERHVTECKMCVREERERDLIEAAEALAAKNLDDVDRTTLHQAVHDEETVRALHRVVYAVRALQEARDE